MLLGFKQELTHKHNTRLSPTYKLYCTCRGHSSINCGGKLASTRLYSDSTRPHSSHVKIYRLTISKSPSLVRTVVAVMLQPFNTSSPTVSGICILYAYAVFFTFYINAAGHPSSFFILLSPPTPYCNATDYSQPRSQPNVKVVQSGPTTYRTRFEPFFTTRCVHLPCIHGTQETRRLQLRISL